MKHAPGQGTQQETCTPSRGNAEFARLFLVLVTLLSELLSLDWQILALFYTLRKQQTCQRGEEKLT
jgi:hypothetical protein